MTLAATRTVDYTDGGDTVKEGVEKLELEINDLWSDLDGVHKCHYGSVEPSNKQEGTLWIKDSDNSLYAYISSAWVEVVPSVSAFANGVSVVNSLSGTFRNCFLANDGAGTLTIYADSAEGIYASAVIDDEMCMISSNETLSYAGLTVAGATDGKYDIYLSNDGDGTFTINSEPIGTGGDGAKTYIGRLKLASDGVTEWVDSYEGTKGVREARPYGAFRAYDSAAAATSTSFAEQKYDTENYDHDNLYATGTGRWTPGRAGLVVLYAQTLLSWSGTLTGACGIQIRKNGSTVIAEDAFHTEVHSGVDVSALNLYIEDVCNSTDYYSVYLRTPAGTWIDPGSGDTFFGGRYIGAVDGANDYIHKERA